MTVEDCPLEDIPEIAVIGRSNVGKSSLLNFLLGRRIAYVSKTPGKTQLIHFFKINGRFHLVDLPGYGYARAPKAMQAQWGPMIEGYLLKRSSLQGLIFLIDIRHPGNARDLETKQWLDHHQIPTLFVTTKGDKIAWGKRKKQVEEIKQALGVSELIWTSAQAKEGREAVWKGIDRLLMEDE